VGARCGGTGKRKEKKEKNRGLRPKEEGAPPFLSFFACSSAHLRRHVHRGEKGKIKEKEREGTQLPLKREKGGKKKRHSLGQTKRCCSGSGLGLLKALHRRKTGGKKKEKEKKEKNPASFAVDFVSAKKGERGKKKKRKEGKKKHRRPLALPLTPVWKKKRGEKEDCCFFLLGWFRKNGGEKKDFRRLSKLYIFGVQLPKGRRRRKKGGGEEVFHGRDHLFLQLVDAAEGE